MIDNVVLNEKENYVAIGTLLSNGTTALSISYGDGIFGIYISLQSV